MKSELWTIKRDVWLWSLKSELWTVKYEVWTVKSELWSLNNEVWTMQCEVWTVNWEVWTMNCEVWTVKYEVWSLNYEVWSLKGEVWTVNWSDRVAKRLAIPTSDCGVSGSNIARFGPNLNGASLHRAFYVHPSIVLIWLKYCWIGCETANHPSMNCELWNGTFNCLLYYKITF